MGETMARQSELAGRLCPHPKKLTPNFPPDVLYLEADGKKSYDGVDERLGLLRDAGSRLVWTEELIFTNPIQLLVS